MIKKKWESTCRFIESCSNLWVDELDILCPQLCLLSQEVLFPGLKSCQHLFKHMQNMIHSPICDGQQKFTSKSLLVSSCALSELLDKVVSMVFICCLMSLLMLKISNSTNAQLNHRYITLKKNNPGNKQHIWHPNRYSSNRLAVSL